MSFRNFTDKAEIKVVLDFFLKQPDKSKSWLGSIRDKKANGIYEGASIIGATTDGEGKRTYSLSNGDSNHQSTIGTVCLDDIDRVQQIPEMIPKKLREKLMELQGPEMA